MSFPRYESYKDSGVDWLEEVPEHWGVLKLTKCVKSIVDYRGKTPSKVDDGIFLLTARNIKEGVIDYETSQEFVLPSEFEEIMRRGKPSIGDLVFTMEAPLGQVANIDRTDVAIAQRIIKMQGHDSSINNYFLKYWFMSKYSQSQLASLATGSTALGLKASKLGQIDVCVPPQNEQSVIVIFLDRETAKIDALITEQNRLIELLKEKRQAVISHAVTKGLNPDVPMKDSGIEWLGEVPEHWEVKRLRFVSQLNPSKGETAELDRRTEISFLPMEAIGDDGSLNLDRTRLIGEVETGYTYFREGDVTIAKITPCFENGKGTVMNGLLGGIGFGTTELIVVRPILSEASSSYLHWLFISTPFRKRGEASMYGTGGQKRVPDDFVRDFAIGVPPIQEQQTITTFLDRETAKIDELIAEAKTAIDLLQERRTALISAAVTGKIDVRGLVKTQPESEPEAAA